MPKSLDLGRLKQFEPPKASEERPETHAPVETHNTNRWPSREAAADGQISIKGPLKTIQRFQALCKDDRRTYANMLNILMDAFEKKT